MPLDLNSNREPIDHTQQQYQDVLQDLQGNILKGHGRKHSVHIFFTFPQNNPSAIKALKQSISQVANDITSAKKQLDDADAWRNQKRDGGVLVHFSLSSSGYRKLGLPNSRQPKGVNLQGRKEANEKQLQDDYANVFQTGMKARQYALLDPAVSKWEPGFQREIDALVIIAANNLEDVKKKQAEITDKLKNNATVSAVEPGIVQRRKFNNTGVEQVVEHFGFTDGIGQPLFLKKDVETEQGDIAKNLFRAPLNLVLVQDPFGTPNVSFGSFLVFRKLEQNVQGFKKAELALANALGISPQLAGAMAVGRFEDGTPLVVSGKDGSNNLNNFDYSQDAFGLKCPFQAHLRTTNPRLESVRKGGPFAQSNEQELGHRIARRGVGYGGEVSDFSNLDKLPTGGVGLLFMCFQSDIWEQFEFIQRFWSNHPRFLEQAMSESRNVKNKNYDRTGLDAVSGQSQPDQSDPAIQEVPLPPQNWLKQRDQPTTKPGVTFAQFVTLKGGEYFFSPSISFLKNLPNIPEDFTPSPIQAPTPAKTYVIQQGDDLARISQRAYGTDSYFNLIYNANKNVIGSDPGLIFPGQIVYIPILPQNTTPTPGQTYTVQQGDYLFLIAQRAYGDGNLSNLIYEANRNVIGPDPTILLPGQQLFIPLRP
ncbi:LysM peptidoglycan-binding domain-containing protein [Iningainema tapete]|uniref:LysM peptidoglycan-binding domain-containing protein n=1 Tax=Iningainema tapete BLCC-T55 TaxID=2748662 RepID=A0A8J6Y1G9_9CYAN|nr:LysM peptidoglycan-binding domain-containing protein [Iningainema tapete]MBD2777538.1 LysM peptidoglycan-binding domain-containing protein [Iningainema tapete BLCC-T55]